MYNFRLAILRFSVIIKMKYRRICFNNNYMNKKNKKSKLKISNEEKMLVMMEELRDSIQLIAEGQIASEERLTRNINEFKKDMAEFKEEMMMFKYEMYKFKDEMYEFKKEMYEFKDEMYEFRKEMYKFKDEMYEFKDEMYEFQEDTSRRFDQLDVTLSKRIDRVKKEKVGQDEFKIMRNKLARVTKG